MATTLSISETKALKGGAQSGQRGYIGYYASANWVMRYKITTPSSMVSSLTLRSVFYNTSSSALSSYPVRVKISASTGYENAGKGTSYDGTMSYGVSGAYNAVCTINGLSLAPNTTYYIYQFPDFTSSYRHLAHDGNATTQTQVTVETHTHSYTSTVTKQPTCATTGIRTYTCSCGSSYTETIAATGNHNYSSTVTKQPTCVVDGVKTYTCTTCSRSYTEAIAATGSHSYVDIVVPPTCTEKGYTIHTCSDCNDEYIDTYVPASHNWEGLKCSVCGTSSIAPVKRIVYIYNGENWIKHYARITNKRRQSYIYIPKDPENAMLGYAILGIAKLNKGELK